MTSLVTISYAQLASPASDLSDAIEAAFGPSGLGLILVEGVPGYTAARSSLLPLATQLAQLPAAELAKLEDSSSHFNFGWSHGKETLEGGQADVAKGSFYANPLIDVPTEDPELTARYPHYCNCNVWPHDSLPALEPALKACGALMVETGLLLAAHCDALVSRKRSSSSPAMSLRSSIADSQCIKARLLHYFPLAAESGAAPAGAEHEASSWCGWHLDHGSLTALTCAQYFDASGHEVPCPDAAAGLYIRARDGRLVKASFQPHQLAFQMGEASQIHSGGLLMATPHCVRGARGPSALGVCRNTFAVFMQPQYDAPMEAPSGSTPCVPGWEPGQDFGQFSAARIALYYN